MRQIRGEQPKFSSLVEYYGARNKVMQVYSNVGFGEGWIC